MPFDATIVQVDNHADALSGIVLEPLSEEIVDKHKQDVIDEFCAQCSRNKRRVSARMAGWRIHRYGAADDTVKTWLKHYGAPRSVIKLAKRIHAQVPEAKLSLQWFYEDPILDVSYDGKVIHLAIWDNGLIAMAKIAKKQSKLVRLFHTILG